MFVVIKTSKENFTAGKHQISWYHSERKQYELVEVTQFSKRELIDIKKEYKDAFVEDILNIIPDNYKRSEEKVIPVKAVPKIVEDSKYRCSDCSLGSATVGGIRRHISKMHGKDKANVIDIATGEIIKDEPVEVESEDNKFKCEECGLKTPSLGGVRRHITKMHGKGACKVIDLATNLPIEEEEEVNDDAPPAFEIADQKVKEASVEEPPKAEVVFTRPKPVKRDF